MTRHMGLACGGTGITPMWQLMEAVLRDKKDKTLITLLYCNSTEVRSAPALRAVCRSGSLCAKPRPEDPGPQDDITKHYYDITNPEP